MHPDRQASPSKAERPNAFSLEIRRAGEVLAVEPVLPSDLAGLRAEALWIGAARRGRPDLTLEAAVQGPFAAEEVSGTKSCGALVFRVGDEREETEITFRRECFLPVAQRAAGRLVAAGVLRTGDEFLYDLRHEPHAPPPASPASAAVRAVAPIARGLPPLARRALGPLLAEARIVDAEYALPSDHAVVFRREVIERSRAIAERGLEARPPIETGGVLLGRRAACPETGEAFVLVDEALEARNALAAEFSLEFSGETWRAFEGVLRRRRAAPDTADQLLIGQFHVHPFLPDGGLAPCADCARRAVCTRSSARLSAEDRGWCKAVFHESPWQLSLMFGLDARGEPRVELYGQRGGALERRAYHLVETLAEASDEGTRTGPHTSLPEPTETPPCPTN